MKSSWGYEDDFKSMYEAGPDMYKGLSGKSVLVTGATGLVGSCLTEFLLFLADDCRIDLDVTVVSSSDRRVKERFGRHIRSGLLDVIVQDIRTPLPQDRGFDLIVHAASVADPKRYTENPIDVIEVTVEGTRNVLNHATKSNARVLYVSSVEVYGEVSDLDCEVTEEVFGGVDPFLLRSSYTESKRLAETLCKAYSGQRDVHCVVARLSKTYGPSNAITDKRVMAHILNTITAGEDITLNSDGTRVFSFCYVTDAVSGLLTAVLKGSGGCAYNVSDPNSVASLKDIALMSAQLAGVDVHLARSGEASVSRDTVVCSDRLLNLGWRPRTDIQSGLEKQFHAVESRK